MIVLTGKAQVFAARRTVNKMFDTPREAYDWLTGQKPFNSEPFVEDGYSDLKVLDFRNPNDCKEYQTADKWIAWYEDMNARLAAIGQGLVDLGYNNPLI